MPGIDWLESQTTNGLNCSHFACFLRNSADYYPLLHAAAPPDLLFQLCKWQKSEIIVLLSPRDTQLSTAAHPRHLGARCPSWGRGSFISSFLHFFISSFISSNKLPPPTRVWIFSVAPPTAPPINTGPLLCYANSADPHYSQI